MKQHNDNDNNNGKNNGNDNNNNNGSKTQGATKGKTSTTSETRLALHTHTGATRNNEQPTVAPASLFVRRPTTPYIYSSPYRSQRGHDKHTAVGDDTKSRILL